MSNDLIIELGNYYLKEIIWKEEADVAFRSIEKKTGKEVTLKVLNTTFAQDHFLREIRLIHLLDIPGILKMVGFRRPLTSEAKYELSLKDPNSVETTIKSRGKNVHVNLSGAIIVTKLKNGSLDLLVKQYLKNEGKVTEKLNPTIRSKIIFGVAAIMKRVHKRNIIHESLSIENIFYDDNSEPLIAYFGVNRVDFNQQFRMGLLVGVPYFLSPEFFYEIKDFSSDVYAFAFLIYMMFTNKIEFTDEKPIKNLLKFYIYISKGLRPKRPESIPDAYWELIQDCWKQCPNDRLSFDEITEKLKNDIYAIEEFGMKTDLDQLHEYQKRIDIDE